MFNIAAVHLPKSDKKSMVYVIKKEYWFPIFSWNIWCLSWARTKYWLLFFRYSNRAINKCDSFCVFSVDLFIKIQRGSIYFRADSSNMYWQFLSLKIDTLYQFVLFLLFILMTLVLNLVCVGMEKYLKNTVFQQFYHDLQISWTFFNVRFLCQEYRVLCQEKPYSEQIHLTFCDVVFNGKNTTPFTECVLGE